MKGTLYTLRIIAFVMVIVGLFGFALAQDMTPVEPLALSAEPVTVSFSTGAAGPPMIDALTDGRMAFRIDAAGEASGTISGPVTARISEVTPMPSPAFHSVSVMFTIETEFGQIDGYYAGSFFLPDGSDQATINGYGRILSVSGAYADLYLAEVFVTSTVQFVDGRSVGESGTMTIGAY